MVCRRALSASGSISLMRPTPASIVFLVPPVSWMVMVRRLSPSIRPYFCFSRSIWNTSQPSPTMRAPARLGWPA